MSLAMESMGGVNTGDWAGEKRNAGWRAWRLMIGGEMVASQKVGMSFR